MSQSSVFLGALATYRLVGREKEIANIREAVPPSDDAFHCLILHADGGKGKTRLLRETAERLNKENKEISLNPQAGKWAHDTVVVLPLIDLGDVTLHTVVGLLREVRQGFKTVSGDSTINFANFDEAWLSYETARDSQVEYAEVFKKTEEIVVAFDIDYKELTKTRRVVWLLDTLEQLAAVPPEVADLLEGLDVTSEDFGRTTYNWLQEMIKRQPVNTTLLLAGRPEPGRWLEDIAQLLPKEERKLLEVADFTLEETNLYLRELCDQLKTDPAAKSIAIGLDQATDEPAEVKGLHLLTQGNPVKLALYIDLFVNADPLPEAFRDLKAVEHKSVDDIKQFQNQLEQDLLTNLAKQLSEPEPQVLDYLSVMRRGLDKARLKYLWGTDNADELEEAFTSLKRFSFIKVRNETLFLHDEFYSIYQRNLIRQPLEGQVEERERQRDIFTRLVKFCEQRALDLTQEIYTVQNRIALMETNSEEYLPTKEEFRRLRAERRRARVERVHYGLYLNPTVGLNNLYFRIAGQAFLANEPDLDEVLQTEVNIFFFGGNAALNRQQVGLSEDQWTTLCFHVLHERVARWIRRLTQLGQRNQAQDFARRAQERHQELANRYYPTLESFHQRPIGELICRIFQLEWRACRCFAALYGGIDITATLTELDIVAKRIEEELRTDRQQNGLLTTTWPEFRWRLRNILAECLEFAGFGYANLYDFKTAEKRYRFADGVLDKTDFRTLHAEVKNDLSRVLGELGALDEALALCREGLVVRELYGFDYLRGLSNNTLALINTVNVRPTRGIIYADKAQSLFRQINNPRGIGLSLIQVAQAKRRIWSLTAEEIRADPASRNRIDPNLLSDVEPLLQEAKTLFSETFTSAVRLTEVFIEEGRLYRDWVAFFGRVDANEQFEKACNAFKQAIRLSQENNYSQLKLSASVNFAWLYGYCKLFSETEQLVKQVREQMVSSYMFNPEQAIDTIAATNVINFRELSKLSSLCATILLADSTDLEARLREHIFAVTYLQLFTRYDIFDLGVTKRQLSRLVSSDRSKDDEIKVLTQKIISEYHLRVLEEDIGPLQAEAVINEALNRGAIPEYLD